jgi:glycosyltransferase involved in cell wall biosynthesis
MPGSPLLTLRRMFGGLWRKAPPSLRGRMLSAYAGLTLPRIAARSRVRPGPVTIVGPLRAITGVGEGARLCHDALARLGVPVSALDITPLFRTPDFEFDAPGLAPSRDGEGTLVVHVNPPQFMAALGALGRAGIGSRKVIGYWVWELPRVPDWWRASLRYAHEIWTPSEFAAAAVRPDAAPRGIPVRVVPHPVQVPVCAPLGRAHFGIPADAFVVFMLFHMGSGMERKNPLAGVRAFRAAFGDSPRARLVLGVKNREDDPEGYRSLLAEIGNAANVAILEQKWSREELNALIQCVDVVLSLHRSEGFGLILAESMLLGRPVVATGWSGNADFMNAENSFPVRSTLVPVRDEGGYYQGSRQMWADPDEAEAAEFLRRLAADPDLGRRIGERARRDALERFGTERYREWIGDSLGSALTRPSP